MLRLREITAPAPDIGELAITTFLAESANGARQFFLVIHDTS
jgi:hypothetical protein